MSKAALVLRAVGRVRLGDHFAELGDPRLDDAIDADLLAYARTVADKGIRACYDGDRSARVTAEPHASAREHLPEAMTLSCGRTLAGDASSCATTAQVTFFPGSSVCRLPGLRR